MLKRIWNFLFSFQNWIYLFIYLLFETFWNYLCPFQSDSFTHFFIFFCAHSFIFWHFLNPKIRKLFCPSLSQQNPIWASAGITFSKESSYHSRIYVKANNIYSFIYVLKHFCVAFNLVLLHFLLFFSSFSHFCDSVPSFLTLFESKDSEAFFVQHGLSKTLSGPAVVTHLVKRHSIIQGFMSKQIIFIHLFMFWNFFVLLSISFFYTFYCFFFSSFSHFCDSVPSFFDIFWIQRFGSIFCPTWSQQNPILPSGSSAVSKAS
jgi:hypothetical protein